MRYLNFKTIRKLGFIFLPGFILAVLCFIGINAAMEPASKSEFCGSQCHEMKDAYRSWELSVHGANKYGIQVGCVDCHLPSKEKEYFAHIFTRAYEGGKGFFKHYFIGGFDSEKARAKARKHMPDKRCMHCHNSLLTRPGSSAARIAHMDVLNLRLISLIPDVSSVMRMLVISVRVNYFHHKR